MRFLPILLLLILSQSSAFADVSRPENGTRPVRVSMTIFLLDLDGIDDVNQSFDANLFYVASWHDPRLAHAGPGKISRPLAEIWHPRLQILNQQRAWSTFPEVASIDKQGNVIYRQRLWGSFSQPFDLYEFPFDSQKIRIPIVAAGYTPDEVEFVPFSEKSSGIGDTPSIPDWDIVSWKVESRTIDPDARHGEPLASFTFYFETERRYLYYVAKVIVPLVLIMAMSWVVFWMDPNEGGSSQIGISVTAMLTLIAYTFVAGSSVPKIPYLTRLDYFILSGTILVFAALVEVATTSVLARRGRLELARRIDLWARWLFPLSLLVMIAESMHFRLLM